MTHLVTNCHRSLRTLAAELAADYDVQLNATEAFARWNLPEEIALEWLDAQGMVDILRTAACCPEEELDLYAQIILNFCRAFDVPDNPVWTHDAMQQDPFWAQQRELARQLLNPSTAKPI